MAGHHDPRLLYSIHGIRAFHIQNGEESELTPSGPQALSLLMVPTSSPFADLSTTGGQHEAPEEDFYLHLNLPPELDLSLPATTQIYHQPPRSYLIPRWDMGPGSGAFTRIEFPKLGMGPGTCTQEDVDTFETILAQCTAFLERAQPPSHQKGYNPQDYKPGEGYVTGTGHPSGGQIVLVDEENGSVVGELAEGGNIVPSADLKQGSKNPVEIQISEDGKHVQVRPMSEDYLALARHPAYKDSALVQNAAAASRLIVTGSSYLSNAMTKQADNFATKTKPAPKPMEFSPATHERVRQIHNFTKGAAGLSAKTVGQVTKVAQNIGATMGGKKQARGAKQAPAEDYKPGFLNKSMIAFSTIADGIAQSGKSLLENSGAAATTVVGHRYGKEAEGVAAQLAGGVKNVGLVYIDVTGVSRRAVIKSVAKGMVVGKVRGGGEVVVGGGDGGDIPAQVLQQPGSGVKNDSLGPGGPAIGAGATGPGIVGFGNAAPPSYPGGSGVGENLAGQAAPGQYPREKY